jgi:hypothetical protein
MMLKPKFESTQQECHEPQDPLHFGAWLFSSGSNAIVKSGRSSPLVFCMAALPVLLKLFVAVKRPVAFELLILDCAAIFLIGLTSPLPIRSRLHRQETRA